MPRVDAGNETKVGKRAKLRLAELARRNVYTWWSLIAVPSQQFIELVGVATQTATNLTTKCRTNAAGCVCIIRFGRSLIYAGLTHEADSMVFSGDWQTCTLAGYGLYQP